MAKYSYPYDNANTSESQYARLAREWQDTGVVGSYGGTDLQVTADSSGMHVFLAAGASIVRGAIVGADAVETLDIDPAHASLPRIDAVIARTDPVNNAGDLLVLPGTPAAVPVRPALTQTDTGVYELLLADVAVAAGAVTIAGAAVTDRRTWIGGRTRVWSTATRPPNPRRYTDLGFNLTLQAWEFHDGTGWVTLIPSTVANSTRWGGYELVVSATTPPGDPEADRIWFQPTS